MVVDFEILLVGLPLIIALLCWNALRRNREAYRKGRRDWNCDQEFGKHGQTAAPDVSTLIPRIQQLRREHVEIAHHRSRHTGYHNQLIAAVRAAILRQPYFQNANGGPMRDPQSERQLVGTQPR